MEEILSAAGDDVPRPEALAQLHSVLRESLDRSIDTADNLRAHTSPDSLAATALYENWERRENMCAVVFGIERMPIINARFGYTVGDQIIAGLQQHLASNLPPGDRLFRWRGPYLLALIERDMAAGLPRLEMTLIGAWCNEYEIKVRDRDAFIPVSLSWEMFPLKDFAGMEDLVAGLDAWTAMLNSKGWSLKEKPV
jgi:GGDEF domain-containing protein